MAVTQVRNIIIQHEADGRVSKVLVNGENLDDLIIGGFSEIMWKFEPIEPISSKIIFTTKYGQIFQDIFKVIDELFSANRDCMAAYLSSFLFERLTPYWNGLIQNGQHIMGITFWKEIISIVHKWEKENGKHVHKGSPYAFVAYNYLLLGDIDTGFSYLYNAIEEDIKLECSCPTLNYPKDSPAYLTAILSSNPKNMFMARFIAEIRSNLENHLSEYRSYFGKTLTLSDIDNIFLQNTALDTIRFYFVFTYWTIFEYQGKVIPKMMQNDFSKLKNASWMFALCLVIDKLLNYRYNTIKMGDGVKKYSISKKLISEDDLNHLIGRENIANGDPDAIISRLLSIYLSYNGSWVSKEIQCLFVAWNLRNFAGHNIQGQNIIVSNFEDLLKILLYDIFLIIEEY
jgi:hypothetical protein